MIHNHFDLGIFSLYFITNYGKIPHCFGATPMVIILYNGTEIANISGMPVNRKVTYRGYPTPRQELALDHLFEVHRIYYNEARQRRIDAYKENKTSISFAEQCKELTEHRKNNPILDAVNAQSLQVTLKRLQLAMEAFFRRIKEAKPGEKPGFPRYKTEQGFQGWGYKDHGNGWKFQITGKRKADIKITGVGTIKTRGKPRTLGIPKTMEVFKHNDKWYFSVTFVCEPKRACGTEKEAYDWGLKNYLTVVNSDGTVTKIENPRPMRKAIKTIKTKQNKLNKMTKGSNRSKKLQKEIANIHEKACNQRNDFLHKTSAKLVSECKVIITEELAVKSMVMDHTKKYSRSLHRSILDGAPAKFNAMTNTKAQEAACWYHEVETKIVKPTQRCSECWDVQPKTMKERTHSCKKCGFTIDRDVNAALVMLKEFNSKGLAVHREIAGQPAVVKCETLPIAANAA